MTPTRLTWSRPRDVRLTAAGKLLAAFATVLLLASLGVPVLILRQQQREAADNRTWTIRGIVTDAEVLRTWKASGENDRHMVAVRYIAGDRAYDAQLRVSNDVARGLTVGRSLRVRYLPAEPRRVRIEGAMPRVFPVVFPYVVGLLLFMLGIVCIWPLRCEKHLLAEGRTATAVVTAIKKQHGSHGATHRSIEYTFRLLSGATATGRSSVSRTLPAVGSTVEVIYDPDQPRRSRRYPLSLVRLA